MCIKASLHLHPVFRLAMGKLGWREECGCWLKECIPKNMLWDTVFPLSPHCFVLVFFFPPKRKKHAWEKNTNVSATCNSYKSSLLASLSPCAFNPSCTSLFKRKASNSTKLHQYRLHGSKETLIPQVPTSSSKTMLLAVISHSHQSHISIKQDCFLLTASLAQHNKGNFSPQRPHLEIQGLTLGMGIRKRRGQISRLSLTGIYQTEKRWGSFLLLRLSELL